MTRTNIRLFPAAFAAVLLAAPILVADTPAAHADRGVRVSGSVRASGSVRVRVRPRARPYRRVTHRRYATPPPPARLHVHGSLYWGGGIYVGPRYYYAPPPPPPPPQPYCDYCEPGYQDYAEPPPPPPPAPVAEPAPRCTRPSCAPPAPATVVMAPPAPEPLPRLGIGVYAGSLDVNGGQSQGAELGLFGRLRLTDRLFAEAELAQSEMINATVGGRLGTALLFDFSPRSRFSLQVLGGVGVTSEEASSGTIADHTYGEIGAGLTYRPTRSLHLAADLRVGARQPVEADGYSSRAAGGGVEAEDTFSRGRLSAILYF